jgi:hypothetical protein
MIEQNYKTRIRQRAEALYATFTEQERRVVQFGMLPAGAAPAHLLRLPPPLLQRHGLRRGVVGQNAQQPSLTFALAVAIM